MCLWTVGGSRREATQTLTEHANSTQEVPVDAARCGFGHGGVGQGVRRQEGMLGFVDHGVRITHVTL